MRLRRLALAVALVVCLPTTMAGPAAASTGHGAKRAQAKTQKKVPKKTKAAKRKAKAKKAAKETSTPAAKTKAGQPVAARPATPAGTTTTTTTTTVATVTQSAPSAAPSVAAPAAAPVASQGAATATVTATAPTADVTASATALFATSYAHDLSSWQSVQEPAGTDRITVVSAPGDAQDALRPSANVMRVELRPADRTDTSGYLAPRAEVFGRAATPMSQSADRWPDPVNAIRWYAFSLYVPSDFTFATDAKWLTLTQWKGLRGGSPPIALEVKRGNLRLGGARANAGLLPVTDLGPIIKGRWTRLVVGMRLSNIATQGWVTAYRDGTLRVPQTSVATMDTINNLPDPVYLKQGIYRDDTWTVTHVLDFGPVKVGSSLDAVA
jgi:hypothetical protein